MDSSLIGRRQAEATAPTTRVRRVVDRRRERLRRASPVLVVVLHDFDFVESGHRDSWISARDFARRLRRLAGQSDVRLHSLGQAGSARLAAVPEQLHWLRRWWRGAQNLPWRYRRVLEDQALWPALSNRTSPAAFLSRQVRMSTTCLRADLTPSVSKRVAAARRVFASGR